MPEPCTEFERNRRESCGTAESGSEGARDDTVGELLDAAAERIAAAGCEEPRDDAEALVAKALGVTAEQLSGDGARRALAGAGERDRGPGRAAAPSTSRSPTSSATSRSAGSTSRSIRGC